MTRRAGLAAWLLLGALAGASGKDIRGRLVLGGTQQMTGRFSYYGDQALNILSMWKEKVDADDSFPYNITLSFEDDESTSSLYTSKLGDMLINRTVDSPDVVICPYTSGATKLVCDYLDDNNLSVLCGAWGGASESIFAYPEEGRGQNLRVQSFGRAGNYFKAGLEHSFEQLSATEAARRLSGAARVPTAAFIWRQTDAFSKSLCVGAIDLATALGFNITLQAAIDPLEDSDGSDSIYQQMKDCDDIGTVPFVDMFDVTQYGLNPLVDSPDLADVVVGCGLYDSQTAVVLGLIARGIRPKFTFMTNVNNAKLLASVLPYNTIDVFMPTPWTPTAPGSDEVWGTGLDFYEGYLERFDKAPSYHGASLAGWLTMLTRALKRSADSHACSGGECELDAHALRAAYEVPEVTFYGTIGLNEYGMNEDMPLIQVQTQLGDGGSFVQVPAIPVDKVPDSWTAADGMLPRWPARSWSEARTDFINSYCGSEGVYIDSFTMMKVGLERAANHFVDHGTSSPPVAGDIAECIQCQMGRSRSSSFAECYLCAAGTFAALPGQAECDLCPVGSAVESLGALECANCTVGRVAGERGRKVCQDCEQGRFMAQEGQSECTNCPVGRYQPGVGQSECLQCTDFDGSEMTTQFLGSTMSAQCICSEGKFKQQDNESCRECPAGMVYSRTGPADFPCSCPADTFLSASGDECFPCPSGMACAAGTGAPTLLPGMWAHLSDDEDRSYSVYRCRDKEQCPGGPVGTCADGRDPDTVGCAVCLAGHVPTSGGHTCKMCESSDYVPFVFAILLLLVGGCLMVYFSTVDVTKTSVNMVVGLAICGQFVIVIQWFSVFQGLDVVWVEPFSSVVKFAAVFSFNFEYLKIGCFLETSNEVVVFASRLMCLPVLAGCLVLMMYIHSRYKGLTLDKDQVMNSVGLIMMVLFLAVTLAVVSPFMCADSPNGTQSIASNPSVICDDNGEFVTLVVLAVIGLLVYSVTPMALVTYVTLMYPSIVASGHASTILTRYRFLFQRFTVERYYYGPIFFFRNFLMALVPVIFVNFAHLQVIVLAGMFVFFGLLSCSLKPWRGGTPNLMEALLMGNFILALMVAGTLVDVDVDDVTKDLQVILLVVVIGMSFPLSIFVGQLVYRSMLASAKTYGIFLSHHKLGMAAGARLAKMELSRRTGKRVFLDSDELDDLDSVLDTVRNGTECLVVMLTTETLWRPWCAGEIAVAHTNSTPIICLSSDGYLEPSDQDLTLKSLSERWSVEQFAPMALEGVTFETVREAYLSLRKQDKIAWKRAGSSVSPQIDLDHMVQETITRFLHAGRKETSGSRPSLVVDPVMAEVMVVANGDDGEAVSSAQVLAIMIRAQMQWHTLVAVSGRDLRQDRLPKAVIVSLTKDAFRSEDFVRTLLAVRSNYGTEPYLMSTRSADFQFPVPEVLGPIQKRLSVIIGADVEQIETSIAPLLSSLALPFFAGTRESLVVAEAQAIASRLRRYTSPSSKERLGRASGAETVRRIPGGSSKTSQQSPRPSQSEASGDAYEAPDDEDTNHNEVGQPEETSESI